MDKRLTLKTLERQDLSRTNILHQGNGPVLRSIAYFITFIILSQLEAYCTLTLTQLKWDSPQAFP